MNETKTTTLYNYFPVKMLKFGRVEFNQQVLIKLKYKQCSSHIFHNSQLRRDIWCMYNIKKINIIYTFHKRIPTFCAMQFSTHENVLFGVTNLSYKEQK